jgi:hypothetical protein
VSAARFRANPRYELVLFDRLPSDQQAVLTDLRADPDFYGILRPRDSSGLAIKSVCRDTALLYLTLQEPGALPGYVAANRSPDTNQSIAEMVLDGVLEIMRSVDGAFVSGAEAYSLLYTDRQLDCAVGKLARLSTDALRYGQALEIEDAGKLSARLYFYNRDPASPRWLRDLPNEDAVLEWMGLTVGSPLWRRLRLTWSEVPASERSEGWRVWHRRNSQSRSAQTYFKLYVSPLAKTIPEAFARTLEMLSASHALRFKIGRDVYGLLRPDKLVAYFPTFEAVAEASESLRAVLHDCPAHGVPFTAELTDDGMLSWGMDPPRDQHLLGWQEFESWRLWLTNRLATSLIAARAAKTGPIEPWRFAMERIALEGINTATWTPSLAIWLNRRTEP